MIIKWQGDTWAVRYYFTGYPRYVLERTGVSVSWLQNEENNFISKEAFVKFLREEP